MTRKVVSLLHLTLQTNRLLLHCLLFILQGLLPAVLPLLLFHLGRFLFPKFGPSLSVYSFTEEFSNAPSQLNYHFYEVSLLLFKNFYCCSITVVCIYLPPLPPTPAKPTSLPCFLPLLVLSMCPLYLFLKTLPPIISSHLPSGYCQIVLNFNVSG